MSAPHVRTHPFRGPVHRLALGPAQQVVERVLTRVVEAHGTDRIAVRRVLAAAVRRSIVGAFEDLPVGHGEILIGLQGGGRRRVPLAGLTVAVAMADPACLAPQATTLLWRHDGSSRLVHDVRFGVPDHLRAAAIALGEPPDLGLVAVEGVVRALARALEPHAPVAALYTDDDDGWEAFRFLQVRDRVDDARLHVDLHRARRYEPDSRPGDLLGVNLPRQDWLSPLLCWLGGAG